MANSNIAYELFGGEYPGKPVPEGSKYANVQPIPELDFDMIQMLNSTYRQVVFDELAKLHPRTYREKLWKDFERQFTLTGKASEDFGGDTQRAIELGDYGEQSGVQIKANLNPKDIIEDPKKWATNNIKGWYQAVMNRGDWETLAERDLARIATSETSYKKLVKDSLRSGDIDQALWQGIRGGSKWIYQVGGQSFQLENLADSSGNSLTVTNEVDAVEAPGTGMGPYRDKVKEDKDLFGEARDAFIDLYGGVRSSGSRNSAMQKLTSASIKAASWEIHNKIADGTITGADEIEAAKQLHYRNNLYRRLAHLSGKGDSDVYIDAAGNRRDNITTPGVTGISFDGLKKANGNAGAQGLKGLSQIINTATINGKMSDWDKFEEAIDDLINPTSGMIAQLNKEMSDSLLLITDSSAKKRFQRDMLKVQGYADSIRSQLAHNMTAAKWAGMSDGARKRWLYNYKGKVDVLAQKPFQSGLFKGFGLRMQMDFLRREFLNRKSDIGSLVHDNPEIIGSKNLRGVLNESFRVYGFYEGSDLIYNLEKDGYVAVAQDYFWNIFRTRMADFTPAKQLETYLKKRQYFGLVYDPTYGKRESKPQIYSEATNSWLAKAGQWLFLSDNIQKISLSIGNKRVNFKFKGDSNLQIGTDLFGRLSTATSADLRIGRSEFFDLLNGRRASSVLFKKRFPGDSFDKFRDNAQGLRQWLLKNNGQLKRAGLGLEFSGNKLLNTDHNYQILRELFGKLDKRSKNADFVSIFQSKVGLLQKLASASSRLQTWIFNRTKFLQPIVWLRTIVLKRVADLTAFLINKITGWLIGLGTGGIGLALWETLGRFIQAIVYYVVRKVFDFAQTFFKSIREADIFIMEKFMQSTAEFMAKTLIIAGVTCAGCLMILSVITAVIFPTFPKQVDNTNTAEGLGGSGGGIDPGLGERCLACCGPNTTTCPADTPTCSDPIATNECEIVAVAGCFVVNGDESDWGAGPWARIVDDGNNTSALQNLTNKWGNYVNKVCEGAGGRIDVVWSDTSVGCGKASWDANTIYFGRGDGVNTGCWDYNKPGNQYLFDYLFAHETGHIYDEKPISVDFNECVDDEYLNGGGILATYNLSKTEPCEPYTIDEHKADVIGVRVSPKCGGFDSAPAYERCAAIATSN